MCFSVTFDTQGWHGKGERSGHGATEWLVGGEWEWISVGQFEAREGAKFDFSSIQQCYVPLGWFHEEEKWKMHEMWVQKP